MFIQSLKYELEPVFYGFNVKFIACILIVLTALSYMIYQFSVGVQKVPLGV